MKVRQKRADFGEICIENESFHLHSSDILREKQIVKCQYGCK